MLLLLKIEQRFANILKKFLQVPVQQSSLVLHNENENLHFGAIGAPVMMIGDIVEGDNIGTSVGFVERKFVGFVIGIDVVTGEFGSGNIGTVEGGVIVEGVLGTDTGTVGAVAGDVTGEVVVGRVIGGGTGKVGPVAGEVVGLGKTGDVTGEVVVGWVGGGKIGLAVEIGR